jgi:hypothetical protein
MSCPVVSGLPEASAAVARAGARNNRTHYFVPRPAYKTHEPNSTSTSQIDKMASQAHFPQPIIPPQRLCLEASVLESGFYLSFLRS